MAGVMVQRAEAMVRVEGGGDGYYMVLKVVAEVVPWIKGVEGGALSTFCQGL
jgi:hypothetical protein